MNEETKKINEEPNKKESLPLWRRIAFALVVLVFIGYGVMMLAGLVVGQMLGSRIKAISKAGYPVSFQQLETEALERSGLPAPPSQAIPVEDGKKAADASPIYTALINKLPPENVQNIDNVVNLYRNSIAAGTFDKLSKELQGAVTKDMGSFQGFMAGMDAAAVLPMSIYDNGIQYGIEVCSERLTQIRKALSLISLRTLYLMGTNEYDRSAMSLISMLRAARVFDTYPVDISYGAKLYYIQLACNDINLLLKSGKLSAPMLDKLSDALEKTLPGDSLKRSLLSEQVFQIEGTRNIIPEKVALEILQKDVPNMTKRVALPSSTVRKIQVRMIVLQFYKDMAKLIEASSRPYPEPLDYVNQKKDKLSEKMKPHFARSFGVVAAHTRTITFVRSALVSIHIEKYRRTNGSLPESLDQIASGIDPAVLTDPYTGGKLIYKKGDQSYLVYSTGDDKIDNGGAVEGKVSQTTGKIEKMPDDIGIKISLPTE